MEHPVAITTDFITLDAFLKWTGIVDSGGQAKSLIATGVIRVNGDLEVRRGRKLRNGDLIYVPEAGTWIITREEP
jgi:ribosome-associated protein